MSTGLCSSGSVYVCVWGGGISASSTNINTTHHDAEGRKDRVKSPLAQCRPRHDEWGWLRVKKQLRGRRVGPIKTPKRPAHGEKRVRGGLRRARQRHKKPKVGQGLGAFASRGLAAASAPSEATHPCTRTSHTARSRLLLGFKFLTGSERFHGRGLSLRLCPGLAAPYRR